MPGRDTRSVLLLAEDREAEDAIRQALGEDWRTVRATTLEAALALLAAEPVEGVIAQEAAGGGRGLDLLVHARERAPHLWRVLATATPRVETALRAVNEAQVSALVGWPLETATLAHLVAPVAGAAAHARARDVRLESLETRNHELAEERRTLSLALEEKASALARLQKSLESLSSRDERTGLSNERYFHLRADQELKRARRYGRPLSVVLCDLVDSDDPGKPRGRAAAEALLAGVGRLLAPSPDVPARVRDTDVVARYGERSFGLLLPDTPRAGAEVVTGRLRDAIADARLPAAPLVMTAGLASFPEDGGSRGELLERAHQALYRASRQAAARLQRVT